MGLQLTTTSDYNVDGNYWRIEDISINHKNKHAAVVMILYKDKASSDAGKMYLKSEHYSWSGTEFDGWFDSTTLDVLNQNPQERAYEKLKTLPEFTGAVDV